MIRIILAFLVCFFIGYPAPAFTQDTQFFHAVPDLPLMEGLNEAEDLTLVFDKPAGRVIEVIATSQDAQGQDVQHFYDTVLPQMGWTRVSVNEFIRAGEHLSIGYDSEPEQLVIRVSITPRNTVQ